MDSPEDLWFENHWQIIHLEDGDIQVVPVMRPEDEVARIEFDSIVEDTLTAVIDKAVLFAMTGKTYVDPFPRAEAEADLLMQMKALNSEFRFSYLVSISY